jgi:hypothetical protein
MRGAERIMPSEHEPVPSQWRPPLPRRPPGVTDLRVFTADPPAPVGRHRPCPESPRVDISVAGRPRLIRPRPIRSLLPVLALVTLVAGCGSSAPATGPGGQNAARSAAAAAPQSLRGLCPDPVVVQTSWYPQAEHGAVYQLLGAGYTIDAAHKKVTGKLVSNGVDTGVRIEIRAGGPALAYQPVAARMDTDHSITLGMVASDELIQQSAAHPLLGVVAPLDLDPQIIMWDPNVYPEWNTISDIGQTDTKVLYFQGFPYMDYLLGSGILRRSQVDSSYDGSPSRLVASRGHIAVQGYVTNEPYAWRYEVRAWSRPLAYQLVADTGYPNYANVLAIRPADRDRLDRCLHRLVPMIQRAQTAFMVNPAATVNLIVAAVQAYHGFMYTAALARYAIATMRREGIVGNGGNPTLGDFDHARIAKLINILQPIFTGQHKPIKPSLGFDDMVTNAYVDPAIGLPGT